MGANVMKSCKRMQIPNTTGLMAPEDKIGLVDSASLDVSSMRGTADGLDETKSVQSFFVADIGDFKLRFQHSFMAPDIGMAGVSTGYKGLFAACPTNPPANV